MARDRYKYFRIEARELIEQLGQSLLELERSGGGHRDVVSRLLRLAHTLKGAARVVRLPGLADRAHAIEDVLSPHREDASAVTAAEIETLLGLVDEIAAKTASLTSAQPDQSASTAEAPTSAQPEQNAVFWAAGHDVAEIDGVLNGIGEIHAQLGSLDRLSETAAQLQRLSLHVRDQLVAVSGDAGARSPSHESLRDAAERLIAGASDFEQGIIAAHQRLDRELSHVRQAVEQFRLVPASVLLPLLERAARDSAKVLGRQVAFAASGGDIRIEAHTLQILQNALQQLVRNAVAHGIEEPAARNSVGKPGEGRITVSVLRRGDRVVFSCDDDGRGIDVATLSDAAVRRGQPIAGAETLDDRTLAHLLLHGGTSTSAVVSEVAGRGIGMEIVRDAVERLHGELRVSTEAGKGTRFELSMPQSISSQAALIVESGGVRAAIPLHSISQMLHLDSARTRQAVSGGTVTDAGEAIPLAHLGQLLERGPRRVIASRLAIIVAAANGRAALVVEAMRGTTTGVFRPLPQTAPAYPIIAGASVDADGRPVLLLDAEALINAAVGVERSELEPTATRPSVLVIDDSLTTRMLEQSILESAGYNVDLAVSGEEGLERARAGKYALVLVDVEMPGMDGFIFIEHMRADQKLRDIPAILVTSRNAPEDRRRGEQVGAQGYVVKSEFDQVQLLDRIGRLIG